MAKLADGTIHPGMQRKDVGALRTPKFKPRPKPVQTAPDAAWTNAALTDQRRFLNQLGVTVGKILLLGLSQQRAGLPDAAAANSLTAINAKLTAAGRDLHSLTVTIDPKATLVAKKARTRAAA
jgi:hypothetical protein